MQIIDQLRGQCAIKTELIKKTQEEINNIKKRGNPRGRGHGKKGRKPSMDDEMLLAIQLSLADQNQTEQERIAGAHDVPGYNGKIINGDGNDVCGLCGELISQNEETYLDESSQTFHVTCFHQWK